MTYKVSAALPFVYRYDGSYPGLLCCIAECFKDKRLPGDILSEDDARESLLSEKRIVTDESLAERIEKSIKIKISAQAAAMVRESYLCCMEEKELRIVRFVLLGYKYGRRITGMLANDNVNAISRALLSLKNEASHFEEFLRFSDYGDFLGAKISPKNSVLPLIAGHFCDRLSGESLLIYDSAHMLAFYYRPNEGRGYFLAEAIDLPEISEDEQLYRELWKGFFNSVSIKERENPKLQRSNLALRYRPNMTEFGGRLF